MKFFVLLTVLVFASKNENKVEGAAHAPNLGWKIMENPENPILVKIEEDEFVKKRRSKFVGVFQHEQTGNWCASRRNKKKKNLIYNGTYRDEDTAAHASDTLARKLMADCKQNYKLNFPDDNTEVYAKKASSEFVGVSYIKSRLKWQVRRQSKYENKRVYYGSYKNEETAAHASDTLARKLIANGEQGHKINFPDDNTYVHKEVHKKKTANSDYIGLYYNEKSRSWFATRWSKTEKKSVSNGYYKDEETAAHASDTLARTLMANGDQDHSLNFADDNTEVNKENVLKTKSSEYFGVCYNVKCKKWVAARRSKVEKKLCSNGTYRDKEMAAHASDSLARKLMENGEQNHKLNFPEESNEENLRKHTEVHKKAKESKYIGVYYNGKTKIWIAQRWGKKEKKLFIDGTYKDEERAAHASDTLARKLMANGDQNLKLNFPDNYTEENPQHQTNKRKRPLDFEYSQANEDNFEKFEENKSGNSPKYTVPF